jgi:hypothetical protein
LRITSVSRERELFPYLEEQAAPEDLADLGRRIEAADS